ncbi:hypothetical protein BUALT_Bualt02G0003000 [Buddleja alternifolia]|uniref:J domain-containing protein n=1 Tax=Buddleja alternifolia TaxID=168488 RepID=A0AAV6XW70_9LAMI|nr:hypothetical protein BUALT_Bualt02G0003000 [Buddleja alternifolia]
MNSKVVSSAEPTLHLCSNPNKLFKKSTHNNMISCISFSSHIANSRISVEKPFGSCRTRPTARVTAFYAPTETAESLYELLGITETGSTLSDIKKAYKQMARKYHPDVSPPDRVDEYTRRFIMVHEAYETLSNPKSRAMYDQDLAGGFVFSKKSHHHHQETKEWKMRWQSQVDELKRRDVSRESRGRMSWGARMRSQR